jgi:hypothetical protein
MPNCRVASNNFVNKLRTIVNGQVQNSGRVATVDAGAVVSLDDDLTCGSSLRGIYVEAIVVVCGVEAYVIIDVPQDRVLNSQVQHCSGVATVYAGATVGLDDDLSRGSGLGGIDVEAVVVVSGVDTHVIIDVPQDRVLNNQMEHSGGVTTVDAGAAVGLDDDLSRGSGLGSVDDEAVVVVSGVDTHVIIDVPQDRVLNNQMEHSGGVTTGECLCGVGVGSRFCKLVVSKVVRGTVADTAADGVS